MKMMKRVVAILLVLSMVLSACMVASATSKTKYVYNTGKCVVRKGAGTNYGAIATIQKGLRMEYVTTTRDKNNVLWYKVRYKGHTGWICSIYISSSKNGTAVKGTVKLTGGTTHIRVKPNTSAKSLGSIGKGKKANYYDTATDSRGVKWYLIFYGGHLGWISSKYTNAPAKEPSTVTATDGKTYIRKDPSLNGKVITVLPRGKAATYKGSTKYDDRGVAWYYVSYGKFTGWVSSRYTTKKY